MNIYRVLTLTALLLLLSSGCTVNEADPSVSSSSKLRILCTTGMLSDPLTDIIGTTAEIKTLMGPGVDPHLYKPSPGDVREISSSDLVLYHGHHLEGRMGDVLERADGETRDGRTRRAIAVTERIPDEQLISTETGTVDPHLWMDISLWRQVAHELREILSEVDPSNSAQFESRISKLDQELSLLDEQIQDLIFAIPEQNRVLVTAHDAFGYFGRRYGLEVIGIQGISTESEASIQRVNSLVRLLTDRKIPAVFVESTVPERNVRALIEGCASLGHTLQIGGVLYSDAPGPPDSGADRWRSMVLHNAQVISRALQ
ncbi:MAG: zinc ABC transporter substrate-binding protein [Planctomycetota bacterium]|nr:zinc ABC transporter substrate-binding protein [Planctomycetota bacterium]